MSSTPKKYVCGYCSRAFTRSEHKQRHERSHTNEKPFHCSYCTSAFVRRDLLQRHCRTVHHVRLVSRAHTKDPRVSKGGSVVSLENTWKPKPSTNRSPTTLQPVPTGDCISPTSNGLGQVSPKTHPDVQPQEVAPKPYSSLSPPKVSPLSPGAKSGSLEEHASPSAISDGHTPRISHAYTGPAHTAANPPLGPRCTTSPALDTESNIVASAKALLQLAPQNSSSDVLQGSPGGGAGGAGLGTPFDPASAPSSAFSPLDVLQILSLSKIFEQYYFPEDLKYPLNEFFYIGYSIIAKKHYNTLPTSHSEIQSYKSIFSQGQPHTFKVGLAYSILAVGCLSMAGKSSQKGNEKLATEFMEKARDSLIEKSVSSQNTPANQLKLLSSLYLLTNVCIGHFDTDSTLAVLEDTTHATIQSLPPHLIETEMELLWKIYILVSESKPYGKPPKFYTWFLRQKLNGTVLADLMRTYSSPGPTDFPIAGKMARVVISTISNELNSLTTEKALWIYSSRLELHSALGCINKSVSYGPNSDIFEIFRRKLIIEASAQCKDLLEASVFEITSSSQLNLLFATLRELDVTLDFHQFMQRNLNSSFQSFVEEARGFFQTEDNYSLRLSGNFGLVSFPLIFNETFLGLQSAPSRVSHLSLNTFERTKLEVLVLQWYALFAKTLVKVVANNHAVSISQAFSKNTVFHSLLAIIKERGKDNFEVVSQSIIPILEEVTKVCGSWLQQAPHLDKFSSNLFYFCRELVILTLNQDKFNVHDVYASNDSLLVRNHRSKSIGSIDTALHPMESDGGLRFFSGPPLSSSAYSHSGFTKNYVLKGEPNGFSMSPTQKGMPSYSPVQPSSAQFSPVQKPTQLSTGVTAIVPVNGFPKTEIPTILPPIHASLRSGGQVHYDMKTSE